MQGGVNFTSTQRRPGVLNLIRYVTAAFHSSQTEGTLDWRQRWTDETSGFRCGSGSGWNENLQSFVGKIEDHYEGEHLNVPVLPCPTPKCSGLPPSRSLLKTHNSVLVLYWKAAVARHDISISARHILKSASLWLPSLGHWILLRVE